MRACKTMCAFPGAVGWSEVHVPAWACMGRISRLTMLDLTCASAQPRFRTPKWRPSTRPDPTRLVHRSMPPRLLASSREEADLNALRP